MSIPKNNILSRSLPGQLTRAIYPVIYPGPIKFSFMSNFLNASPFAQRELVHFYTMYGSCKKLRLSNFKRIWQLQKLGQLESWAGVFLSQLRSWELELLILFSSCNSCKFFTFRAAANFHSRGSWNKPNSRRLQLEPNPDLRLKFDSCA